MRKHDIIKRPEEEQLRHLKAEVERLSNLPTIERDFYIPKSAEAFGIPPAGLKAMVHAILKERAEQVAARHLEEDREWKQREQQRLAEDKKQEQTAKAQTREREQAEKIAERRRLKAEHQAEMEKQRAGKEAEHKEKEKLQG